jgi:hypothetical protein
MFLETNGLRVQLISDLHLDYWRRMRHMEHV